MIKNTVIFLILLFLPSVLYGEVTVSMEELGERIPINSPIDGFDNNSNSYLDPFKNDPILFTITSENYKQFEQNVLTPGQITMFETYPNSFKMNIYKSRRSCSVPQEVIDLTVENAIMTNEGEGI